MLHFTDFTGYVIFIITSFLAGVESADQCLLNSKSFILFFWGRNEYKIVFSILFVQSLTRGMHLISILSTFLTYLGIFQQPQLMVQPMRYNRACHNYDNFSSQHSMLAERLFKQGFSERKLMKTFYKFMGRYPELASKFNKSPLSMICDSVPMAQLYHTFLQVVK